VNQNIYAIKMDKSTIEFSDLLNIFKRTKIQCSVEIMPWEPKKGVFYLVNQRCYYTNSYIWSSWYKTVL